MVYTPPKKYTPSPLDVFDIFPKHRNEDNLKNEDNFKNEDDLKDKDILKDEDNTKITTLSEKTW